MSVAYDLMYGKETLEFDSPEDMINFIIDHYGELMSVYRVMKAQHFSTQDKKINAHLQLQDLRQKKDLAAKDGMTELEKLAFEENEKHYAKLREEDDIHHYQGKPLEQNQLTLLILHHPRLMMVLDQLDALARLGLSKVTRKVVESALYPVKRLTKSAIRQSEPKGKTRKFLRGFKDVLFEIPGVAAEMILAPLDVNLEDHLPKEKEKDKENEITIDL